MSPRHSTACFRPLLWPGLALHTGRLRAPRERCGPHLVAGQNLAVRLLHLAQLSQEVPTGSRASHACLHNLNPHWIHFRVRQARRTPELALGAHGVGRPELHAVDCRLRLPLAGQVAAHHLVLVVLVPALRADRAASARRRRASRAAASRQATALCRRSVQRTCTIVASLRLHTPPCSFL